MFIDNVQNQGPFDPEYHTIYQSNLCLEILLPTVAMGTTKKKFIKVKKEVASDFLLNKPEQFVKLKKLK